MRQQAIQIEDLKAEVAELRERLSQNSRQQSLITSLSLDRIVALNAGNYCWAMTLFLSATK
jgi:hypothetical protein